MGNPHTHPGLLSKGVTRCVEVAVGVMGTRAENHYFKTSITVYEDHDIFSLEKLDHLLSKPTMYILTLGYY